MCFKKYLRGLIGVGRACDFAVSRFIRLSVHVFGASRMREMVMGRGMMSLHLDWLRDGGFDEEGDAIADSDAR